MWNSLYDKLQTFHQCIEVESPERDATNHSEKLLVCESGELYTTEIFILPARCYNFLSILSSTSHL